MSEICSVCGHPERLHIPYCVYHDVTKFQCLFNIGQDPKRNK